jgi:guanylate kinase
LPAEHLVLLPVPFIHIFQSLLKDEDLQEMEELAQKMESQFGQFFDHVIVNDNLQDACGQLLSAIQKAQEELQWVPEAWVSPDTES